MTLFCLASAHGSPGVTTTALALAAAWPKGRRPLLVEADPFGGVLAPRFGLWDSPGLASLTVGSRKGIDLDVVWGHAQLLPGGLPVLVGPPSADEAHAVLRDLASTLADWSAGAAGADVIVDCGRLTSAPPTLAALQRADAVLLLSRPSADQLRPIAHRMTTLDAAGVRPRLLLVGGSPYGPAEVASTLGVEVAGVMAWDPPAAEVLGGGPGPRGLRRTTLVRTAASVAQRLVAEHPGSADGAASLEEPGGEPSP